MEVWPYCPQAAVTESLEWLTDVQRCRSAEYRACLRKSPRQEFQYRFVMTPSQFGEAKVMAQALGASSLLVPLWPSFREPGSLASGTTSVPKSMSDSFALFDVDTSVLIWESASKWEVHTVAINSTNPAYPYITLGEALGQSFANPAIVPLRVGEFAQEFDATRSSSLSVETEARFRVLVGDDHSGDYNMYGGLYSAVSYDGHPIVVDRSLVGSGMREQFERRYEEVDSVIGGAYRFATLSRPEQSGQISWSASTLTGQRALLYWLHSRKGQWKSFWVPSWNGDLTITHEIASTDTYIEISDIGLRTRASFPLHIMILTKAGARVYCKVTGAAAGSAGKELIGLSAQVGASLYTWEISAVCMLTLCRFGSDRIEIAHGTGGHMSATAPIVEVPA